MASKSLRVPPKWHFRNWCLARALSTDPPAGWKLCQRTHPLVGIRATRGGRVGVAPPRRWEAAFKAVACEEVHRRTAGDTLRGRAVFSTKALASRTSRRSGPAHLAGHPWQRGGASSFAVDPDDRSFSDPSLIAPLSRWWKPSPEIGRRAGTDPRAQEHGRRPGGPVNWC
jgi:hypothetical protein